MTLIFSHFNELSGLFTQSDIVVSIPSKLNPAPISLPFRSGTFSDLRNEYALAGVSQKTVIANRTMFLWAGQLIAARQLAMEIMESSNDGKVQLKLNDIIRNTSLSSSELDEISFVYHYLNDDSSVSRFGWRTRERRFEQFDILGAGSGLWHYFDHMELSIDNRNKDPRVVLPDFLPRAMSHSLMEASGTMSLDFLYGGWFEMAQVIDGNFRKLPYAVVFWEWRGEFVQPAAIWFCWYGGYELHIIRITKVRDGLREYNQRDSFALGDFLNRRFDPRKYLPAQPCFIMHHRLDSDGTYQGWLDPYCEEMSIHADENGEVWYYISRKLKRRIAQLKWGHPSSFGKLRVEKI